MGRAYQDELGDLSAVASRLPARGLERLGEAVEGGCHDGIVVVASGGARVVAEWFCLLHLLHFGRAATSLTPLQYAALRAPIEGVTWFVSAGGSHPDIMRAAQACVESGSRRAAALIGRTDSPLSQFLKESGHTHVVSLDHPAKLDGFLATNSIWSMALAVAHAYRVSTLDSTQDLIETSQSMLAWAERVAPASPLVRSEGSLVLLHDGWTWLGALDFEIRCIEASLQRVWRADFRNFGHGRHYWVADRSAESEVMALAANDAKELAASTLAEIPPDIPSQTVMLPYDGVAAALASVAWSIYRVGAVGVAKSRDPGRPGVPAFGERLYEGQYRWPDSNELPSAFTWALARKIGRSACQKLREGEREQWRLAYARFVDRLSAKSIRGVVFDFDGTLLDTERRFDPIEPPIVQVILALLKMRIPVGIATGRGDSAYKSLANAISDEQLRGHVIVGYHNGADVRKLSERADDLDDGSVSPQIAAAAALLEKRLAAFGGGRVRAGTTQCTVTPRAGLALETLWSQCSDLLHTALPASGLKILMSSHSIDITVSFVSKLRVVEAVAKTANCIPDDILRVGDKGAWPGNDCELLKAPLGVSVDECSFDPDTCWNLASRGCFGPRATVELFANIEAKEQGIGLLLRRNDEA